MRDLIETAFVQIENVGCNYQSMGNEDCVGAKQRFGNTNAACTVSGIGGSARRNSRIGKLCPGRVGGIPEKAERIRGRDRFEFCERTALDSGDEFLEG